MSESGLLQRPLVVVASELTLVAEAVSASLADADLDAVTLPWPDEGPVPGLPLRRPAVGLIISELDTWERIQAAGVLIHEVPLSWVVLTPTPEGPRWGAVLEAGALVVMPSTADLESVREAVVAAVRGTDQTPAEEREELVGLWSDLLERIEAIGERIHRLTPREHEVLTMLHAGHPVASIAQFFEVSPATVRSQVKAVRRKLEVTTQLGAVAALDDVLTLQPTPALELQA